MNLKQDFYNTCPLSTQLSKKAALHLQDMWKSWKIKILISKYPGLLKQKHTLFLVEAKNVTFASQKNLQY